MTSAEPLNSQTLQLGLIYGATAIPMAVAFAQRRARWTLFLKWPLIALAVAAVGAAVWTLIRSRMLATSTHVSWLWIWATGIAFFAVLGYLAGMLIAGNRPAAVHKRGAFIETGKTRPKRGELTLAGVGIPVLDETKHFKLIGTTGTGKSTAIRELLAGLLERGDRVILADPDGGYLRRFYDVKAGDLILSPFDDRSRRWDLFGEIEKSYDVDQLVRSLIPDQDGMDKTWRAYARTFLAAIARQLWELGAKDAQYRDVREFYRLVTTAETEELKILVKNTPAQPFLESGNERMFGSIRSVASANIAALEHVAEQTTSPLSVRQWVRGGRGRALYLPYTGGQISTLRSVISAWMRLAIFEAMEGGERDQRLWFIVDELDALGAIDGLKDALARLRKFGGRCVLGFQSIAQVSSTYGQGEAQTIVENCGNTLILRCSSSEGGGTSRFASRLIGDRDILRIQESRSRSTQNFRTQVTRSEHHATEPAVLPAEIEQLPDLQGYLKLASSPGWRRITVPRN
ncbi:MAG: type IV secretion system DNA-binding domain-containing protein [Proteobacteria bacterium]|nr:type IV secretion system DNA-binding domain-containing protein [Pseudomonadota bacterium]